jgi:hypothetical protein
MHGDDGELCAGCVALMVVVHRHNHNAAQDLLGMTQTAQNPDLRLEVAALPSRALGGTYVQSYRLAPNPGRAGRYQH